MTFDWADVKDTKIKILPTKGTTWLVDYETDSFDYKSPTTAFKTRYGVITSGASATSTYGSLPTSSIVMKNMPNIKSPVIDMELIEKAFDDCIKEGNMPWIYNDKIPTGAGKHKIIEHFATKDSNHLIVTHVQYQAESFIKQGFHAMSSYNFNNCIKAARHPNILSGFNYILAYDVDISHEIMTDHDIDHNTRVLMV